jgi:hypothetical protein
MMKRKRANSDMTNPMMDREPEPSMEQMHQMAQIAHLGAEITHGHHNLLHQHQHQMHLGHDDNGHMAPYYGGAMTAEAPVLQTSDPSSNVYYSSLGSGAEEVQPLNNNGVAMHGPETMLPSAPPVSSASIEAASGAMQMMNTGKNIDSSHIILANTDLVGKVLSLAKVPTRTTNKIVINQSLPFEKLPTTDLFAVNISALEELRRLPAFWGCRFRIPGTYFVRCSMSSHGMSQMILKDIGDRPSKLRRKGVKRDPFAVEADQHNFGPMDHSSGAPMVPYAPDGRYLPVESLEHNLLPSFEHHPSVSSNNHAMGDYSTASVMAVPPALSTAGALEESMMKQAVSNAEEIDVYNMLMIFFRLIARVFSSDKTFTNAKVKVRITCSTVIFKLLIWIGRHLSYLRKVAQTSGTGTFLVLSIPQR